MIDLSECPDEQIEAFPLTPRGRLALLLLKHVRRARDLAARIVRWSPLIAALYATSNVDDRFQTFLLYILEVRDGFDHEALARILGRRIGPHVREEIMSTARQLEEKGMQKGLQEGRRAVLLRLLEQRFGPLPPEFRARIDSASLPDLDRWTDRILVIDAAEQLFEE